MKAYVGHEFKHHGLNVEVIADEDAQAPENDDSVFIVTTRNRYFELLYESKDVGELLEDKVFRDQFHVFMVRAYIHGQVALSLNSGGQFSDPWDSGTIGAVFISKSEFKYRNRITRRCTSATKAAQNVIESWNQYLSGDIWGVVVKQGDTVVDSCWGFYGLEEAKAQALEMAETQHKEALKVGHMEARN